MLATQLAEDIARIYFGGDITDESGLQLEDFEDAVQSARAYKIKFDYWQSSRIEGERYINQSWLQNYENVPVLHNEATNVYYSVLPAQVFGDLPRGKGLYFVCPMQDSISPIVPMTIGEQWLFSALPQDNCASYYFDTKNIYYSRFDPNTGNVFMQIIPLNSDTIPDEVAHEISDLVLNKFLKPKQLGVMEDKLTNNNPNKGEVDANNNVIVR